jgi:hypothetical protein
MLVFASAHESMTAPAINHAIGTVRHLLESVVKSWEPNRQTVVNMMEEKMD